MQITTLGTSHGSPTCSRFSSSTLIETAGRAYLVDAGSPVHALLVRAGKSVDPLSAVFVTHMHEDHAGGLHGLCKHFVKERRDTRSRLRVFLPDQKACEPLDAWCRALCFDWPNEAVSLEVTSEGEVYADDCITVTAERTRHMASANGAPSFAYAIRAEGQRVVFTGDLAADFTDFPALARDEGCDLCVCEATHYDYHAAASVLKHSPTAITVPVIASGLPCPATCTPSSMVGGQAFTYFIMIDRLPTRSAAFHRNSARQWSLV